MGRSDIVHGPSFNAIVRVYLKAKTTKNRSIRSYGSSHTRHLLLHEWFSYDGIDLFSVTFLLLGEMASVKMRPARSAESMDSLQK